MKKFLQIVKMAALEVYEAKKPCDFFYGKVENTSPFVLRLDNNTPVPEELLVFVDSQKTELNVGEKVVVLRKSGGQKFLILGRCL